MADKRLPANTTLDELTFLNDKKIDGELYALLQSYSYPDEEKRTIVNKSKLPLQKQICEKLNIKSPNTLRSHLNYLMEKDFIIDKGKYYLLPNREEIYFMLPLETVKFLRDALREQIVKIYVYLGQRWKYKQNNYVFTIEEIALHVGINLNGHSRNYEMINNALICLKNNGLIDYVEFYDGDKPRKRLTNFSTIVKNIKYKSQKKKDL